MLAIRRPCETCSARAPGQHEWLDTQYNEQILGPQYIFTMDETRLSVRQNNIPYVVVEYGTNESRFSRIYLHNTLDS